MATDNSAHPPVARASLDSDDESYSLEFVLIPLSDERHSDWHSYEIHMKDTRDGTCWSLVSSDEHTLFLDRRYEPEIPVICYRLRRCAETGESFTFSPADERDFRLDVTAHPSGLRIAVQFDVRPAPKGFGWPEGVLVSKERACRFAEALETAFRQVAR